MSRHNPYLSPWGPSQGQGPGPGPDLTSGLVINPPLARSSSDRYCVYFQDDRMLYFQNSFLFCIFHELNNNW